MQQLAFLPRTLSDHDLERVLKTVPVRNPSVLPGPWDVVVTHCHEKSLDWLLKVPASYRTIYLYYKGIKPCPIPVPDIPRLEFINMDNVGREGHTIVYHCLRCMPGGNLYEKVKETDVIVFAQTFDPRHIDMQVQLRPDQFESYVFAQDWVSNHVFRCDPNFTIAPEHARNMQPYSPLTFRQFYEQMFKRPMPPNLANSYGNCFSIRVARIRRHSRAVYERLLAELSLGVNPLVGHYFERLSYSLFGAADAEFPAVLA